MNDYFKWHCPKGNLHTFFNEKDCPITTDEHFWILRLPSSFGESNGLVIRYEGDLEADSYMLNCSHRKIAHTIFHECERLPKGLQIKRTYASTLPSAFIGETLTEKFLDKII